MSRPTAADNLKTPAENAVCDDKPRSANAFAGGCSVRRLVELSRCAASVGLAGSSLKVYGAHTASQSG